MPSKSVSLRRLAIFGSVGGVVIGLFVGAMISGPHLHTWRPYDLAASFATCVAICTIVGGVFFPLLAVSLSARGSRDDGPNFRFGFSAKDSYPSENDGAH